MSGCLATTRNQEPRKNQRKSQAWIPNRNRRERIEWDLEPMDEFPHVRWVGSQDSDRLSTAAAAERTLGRRRRRERSNLVELATDAATVESREIENRIVPRSITSWVWGRKKNCADERNRRGKKTGRGQVPCGDRVRSGGSGSGTEYLFCTQVPYSTTIHIYIHIYIYTHTHHSRGRWLLIIWYERLVSQLSI